MVNAERAATPDLLRDFLFAFADQPLDRARYDELRLQLAYRLDWLDLVMQYAQPVVALGRAACDDVTWERFRVAVITCLDS